MVLIRYGGIRDKAAIHSTSENEGRELLQSLREKHHVIVPQNLPSTGPNRLSEGLRAMDVAYENAVRALNTSV